MLTRITYAGLLTLDLIWHTEVQNKQTIESSHPKPDVSDTVQLYSGTVLVTCCTVLCTCSRRAIMNYDYGNIIGCRYLFSEF